MGKGSVVVADCDRRSAGALTWLLAERGYDARLASPAAAVEQTLKWRSPDVLLIDGQLPELGAMLRRLRATEQLSRMRVIVATQATENEVGRVPDGADDCVEKPYRVHEVLHRIEAQLRHGEALAAARDGLRDAQGEADRARDSSANNRRLAEVLRDVADELSTPEIYRVLARRVGRALGVRHCAVILASPDEGATTAVVAAALEEPGMIETTIALVDYPEIARALSTGRPVLVEDAEQDATFAEVRRRASDDDRAFNIRSVIALPFSMDESSGALFIRTELHERALTGDDVEFASLVMHAAVAAIRRGQALETTRADNRRLEELATTDPLTRLLNRRAMEDRLSEEMDRARRFKADVAIMLIDVDYFKRVNDAAGHLAGDEVLRQISGLLDEAVRRVDIVARYGGEEFVLILPETSAEGARTFGERLSARIADHEFGLAGRNIRLTVSVGIANFPSPEIASADDFLARADEALYRAKEGGRNQVRS